MRLSEHAIVRRRPKRYKAGIQDDRTVHSSVPDREWR